MKTKVNKTNFPKRKYFLFPDGWEDLGQFKGSYKSDGLIKFLCHGFCGTRLHIGREGGILFRFCPRCKIITNKKT